MCGGLHICFVLVESELRLLEACGLLSILEGAGEEVRRVLRNKGNKRENLIDAIAVAQSLTCALFVLEQFAAEGSLFLFYFRVFCPPILISWGADQSPRRTWKSLRRAA